MKTTTRTETQGDAAPLGFDCNRNPYISKGTYRTTDGKASIEWSLASTKDGPEFSASGTYDRGGGQNIDKIAEAYPNDATVQEIAAVWEVYHLNGMKAGCEHQRAAGWGEKELTLVNYSSPILESGKAYPSQAALETNLKGWVVYGGYNVSRDFAKGGDVMRNKVSIGGRNGMEQDEYAKAIQQIHGLYVSVPKNPHDPRVLWFAETFGCKRTEAKKLATWVRPSEHVDGVLCKPCPTCGYAFGSQWLHMPIPAEIVEQIKSWSTRDNSDGLSQYDHNAAAFLSRFGITMRITLSDSKPAPFEVHGHHYRITMSRPGKSGRLAFDFWGSQNDAEKGEDPSEYDVLSCIASDIYTPDTFEDFCSEYGDGSDSIKAKQLFRRCDAHAKRLRAFFGSDEIEALAEIN